MKKSEVFSNKVISFIKYQLPDKTEIELEQIKYGIEALYLSITKLIIIFTIAYFVGMLRETITCTVFLGLLRFFAYGVHAKNSINCTIISLILLLGIPLLSKYLVIPLYIKIISSIICFILYLLYAPADTEERPLVSKEKRMQLRILSLIICTAYIFLVFYSSNEFKSNMILLCLIAEGITISPLLYTILNRGYRNYEKYV